MRIRLLFAQSPHRPVILIRLRFMIVELFPKYQPGTKCMCLIILILRLYGSCDAVFHTIPTQIMFRGL